jgi:hypothetical protein
MGRSRVQASPPTSAQVPTLCTKGTTLLFVATDCKHGRELWAFPVTEAQATSIRCRNSDCVLGAIRRSHRQTPIVCDDIV